jgi:hypothetical protein
MLRLLSIVMLRHEDRGSIFLRNASNLSRIPQDASSQRNSNLSTGMLRHEDRGSKVLRNASTYLGYLKVPHHSGTPTCLLECYAMKIEVVYSSETLVPI